MSLVYSRRAFLSHTLASGAILVAPSWTSAAADSSDPRVREVISKTIGVDMHNHVYPAGTEPHIDPTMQAVVPKSPKLSVVNELKQSGLTAVCASFVLDFTPYSKPDEALKSYMQWLDVMDTELRQANLQRAFNVKDLESAHTERRVIIVQSVEGAQFIEGRIERVKEVYDRGVRHLQLLHMKDDLVSPLGDTIERAVHLGGLTKFGAEVVHECNRLGILIDLAHATPETILAAVKLSSRPLVLSHTGLDTRGGSDPAMAERMKSHLISQEHAKVVADAGGVIGVWTKLTKTPVEFVGNLRAMVNAIGIDHVGIGTDLDMLSSLAGQSTREAWTGVKGRFFYVVVGEMLRQGFTVEEIGKVGGGNFCRVFGAVTGVAA